jgi:hypothetical protein
MTTQYTNGRLSLDLVEVIQAMSDDQQLALIEALACQDAVIKAVSQQILDGWTATTECRGSRAYTGSPCPLDTVILEVAKRSSEVAEKEITKLLTELNRKSKYIGRLHQENHKLKEKLPR